MNDMNRIAVVALVVGFVARLLKDCLPSLPRKAIPWVSMGLSVLVSVIAGASKSSYDGYQYTASLLFVDALNGIVSGSLAVTGHEALRPIVEARFGKPIADFVFGAKKGGNDVEEKTPPSH